MIDLREHDTLLENTAGVGFKIISGHDTTSNGTSLVDLCFHLVGTTDTTVLADEPFGELFDGRASFLSLL